MSPEHPVPGEDEFPTHAEVDPRQTGYFLVASCGPYTPRYESPCPCLKTSQHCSVSSSRAVPYCPCFIDSGQRVLEAGTLAGVSTFFLAKGLPKDGQLGTLEVSEKHAQVARGNFERSGLVPKPRVHVGPASETLKRMEVPEEGPYDLVFIDADKAGTLVYVQQGLRLLRKGGLIVVDIAIRGGRVALTEAQDPRPKVTGMRVLFDWIRKDDGKTVLANVTRTVGAKFYDGFAILTKLAD
ncbi:hypothetical protein IAR50_001343 [Cryptococcus sp. DSM 104548]